MEECRSTILHDNIKISSLMVDAQQVEERRLRRKNRKAKLVKSYDSGFSKGRLEIQVKPRFQKRFYNLVPSKLTKVRDDRVSKPKWMWQEWTQI